MTIFNNLKMNFDGNLFLNFIPLISAATLTLVTSITIIIRIKNRWPTRVNCWFCNCTSKVARQSLDWWFCTHCEQYNGFSEDGDYKYDIPEQRGLNKNPTKQSSYCETKPVYKSHNSLCKQCNKKEELKLSKLREIENSSEEFNMKQIERFERSFEKKYPLCMKCESTVQNVLYKQMLWLTQYKMLLFKQKPIKRIIANREWIEKILRVILSILASIVIYFTEVWYLPLCGIFFQLAACVASPVGRRQSDIFPILGWICLIWVRALSTTAILKTFKIYSSNDWMNDHDSAYQYFIITLGTAIGLSNLKFKTHKTLSEGSLSFKKLESPNWSTNTFSRSPSPESASRFDEETIFNKEKSRNFNSPVNITDSLMTPTAIETPIPLKPTCISQVSMQGNQTSLSSRLSSRASTTAADTETSFSKISNTYSLNDSLTSLNSLSLGNKISPSSRKVFETRVYGTTSPDLFVKRLNYKRSILAPPKLRSVTQTSWVAGGYWQSGISDLPTLSRSSSQSSGFGSSGSVYGVSREPSVHDFDQCSVVSDPCYFARPESPLTVQNSTVTRQKSNNCSLESDETLQYHVRNDMQCNGHTKTTIVTNPIWLSLLLCGSLVFNMIVLTTILLR